MNASIAGRRHDCKTDKPCFRRDRVWALTPISVAVAQKKAALSVAVEGDQTSDNRALEFPTDHANHPGFQSEWWHMVGNLESGNDRQWGYQFTIFRHRPSYTLPWGWALRIPWDGYVGHLVITDTEENEFTMHQTRGNSLFNSAGADEGHLGVWVDGWRLHEKHGRMFVCAGVRDLAIDLELHAIKPPASHGNNGFSRKHHTDGGASYHYSITSLQTLGYLTWQGERHTVNGKSWLDREFGTKFFSDKLRGWDWFSLMLDNGLEIMITLIRDRDGRIGATSYGTVVLHGGDCHSLGRQDLKVQALDYWQSPNNGAHYPMGWRVVLPPVGADLTVMPRLANHELVTTPWWRIDYWEGPVTVSGTMSGAPIAGKGYVELTGYAQPIGGKF